MMKILLMRLYQLPLCCKRGNSKFPDHLLYMKEEVDALPEQDNYIPYQEDDFMFIFSDDKYDNMYGAECSRIDSLCVCTQKRR